MTRSSYEMVFWIRNGVWSFCCKAISDICWCCWHGWWNGRFQTQLVTQFDQRRLAEFCGFQPQLGKVLERTWYYATYANAVGSSEYHSVETFSYRAQCVSQQTRVLSSRLLVNSTVCPFSSPSSIFYMVFNHRRCLSPVSLNS